MTTETHVRPAKVLFLERRLGTGGVERILVNLIESFDRSKVLPSLVLLQDEGVMAEELKAGNTPIYSKLGRKKADLHMLRALVDVIRKEQPDVIYTTNYPMTMFYGRLAGTLAGVNTLVVALHTMGYIHRPTYRSLALRTMSPFISRLVAVSQGQKRYYSQTQGVPARKIEVIYGAVDLDRFNPANDAGTLKADLGVPQDASVVGILATMSPVKRHDVFLDMAKKVLAKRNDVYFFLVGDGPERSKLESIVDGKSLRPFVRFLGNRSDVPTVLRSFDISVLCSQMEAFPQCLLEAMATGLPVVSTNVGSIDEIVRDGQTGFLTPQGEAGILAEKVLYLLEHPEEAGEMGRSGRKYVEEHFSKAQMVKHFEDFFVGLATKRGM